jgi:hypothetical protein
MASPSRPSWAELDDELQAMLDLELGDSRRRVDEQAQAERDRRALHAIAGLLRNPDWDGALLDDIVQLLRDTGRRIVGAPPLQVYRD